MEIGNVPCTPEDTCLIGIVMFVFIIFFFAAFTRQCMGLVNESSCATHQSTQNSKSKWGFVHYCSGVQAQ